MVGDLEDGADLGALHQKHRVGVGGQILQIEQYGGHELYGVMGFVLGAEEGLLQNTVQFLYTSFGMSRSLVLQLNDIVELLVQKQHNFHVAGERVVIEHLLND